MYINVGSGEQLKFKAVFQNGEHIFQEVWWKGFPQVIGNITKYLLIWKDAHVFEWEKLICYDKNVTNLLW